MTAPAARAGATPAKQTNHIFVSSTSVDLQEYRAKVTETVLQLESVPVDMKFFGAAPEWPLAECIARAKSADALIAIVANRYGWRPTLEQGGDGKKSVTWYEVDAALAAGKPVFGFIADPKIVWNEPAEPEDEDAQRSLAEFKTFLRSRLVVVNSFTTPDDLRAWVATSLASWLIRSLAGDKPVAYGLPLLAFRQVHRYLNDAGDFETEFTYTVSNDTRNPISLLLPDSVSFLVADPEALEKVTEVSCGALKEHARVAKVQMEQISYTPVKTTKLDGSVHEITRIAWRPRVMPALGRELVLQYFCRIATKGTEKAAFSNDGSFIGFATVYDTKTFTFAAEAPPGHHFDPDTLVPYGRTEDGSMVDVAGLPTPVLENDNRRITWTFDDGLAEINVNYLLRIRFVRDAVSA